MAKPPIPIGTRFRKKLLHLADYVPVIWNKFSRDSGFQMAAALSFSTIISLVPIATLSFSIISSLKFFSGMEDQIKNMLFQIFIPAQAENIENYILAFSKKLSSLNTISIVSFLTTGIFLLITLENNLNKIWKVKNRKGFFRGIIIYWTVLTLGPLLIGVSFYITNKTNVGSIVSDSFIAPVFSFISSYLMNAIFLFILYFWMPNAKMKFLPSFKAAFSIGFVYEILKNIFSSYIHGMSYSKIYGSLAVLPIFLVWLYMVWITILVGAQIAYFMQHPDAAFRDDDTEPGFLLPMEIQLSIVRSYYFDKTVDHNSLYHEFTNYSVLRINTAIKLLTDQKLLLFHPDRGFIPYSEPENLLFSDCLNKVMQIGEKEDPRADEVLKRMRKAIGEIYPESLKAIALMDIAKF